MRFAQIFALALILTSCAGPTQQPTATVSARPSPTIAVMSAPAPAPLPGQGLAPATVNIPKTTPTPMPGGFNYVWPAYLPEGMRISAKESRIAGEKEIGRGNMGFFLLSFSADGGKRVLSLGGGAVEPFKLEGETKQIEINGRPATLITQGEQRLISLEAPVGSLFVLGAALSEEELLKVVASLEPTDVRTIRQRLAQ